MTKKIILGLTMLLSFASTSGAAMQVFQSADTGGTLRSKLNSNFSEHESEISDIQTGKETKAVVQASAPADTTVDWYDTDQESGALILKRHNGTTWARASSHGVQYLSSCASIAAGMCVDTDDGKLYYYNGTAVVEVGTGGSGTTYTAGTGIDITSGVISSTVTGTLPSGTEGQSLQKGASAWEVVDLAPLAFGGKVVRDTGTGLVSIVTDASPTNGSENFLTSDAIYDALAGKENADSTIVKVAEIDTQAEFEALLFPLPSGGTGGYVTPPVYSDSDCTAGTYSFHATYGLIYCKATNTWDYQVVSGTSLAWASWNNLTPVTHSLTITPSGFTGADKFTYSATDYTTEHTFSGLTADASFTITPDTGRAITCTGTGLTDNTGGSYTSNTDTTNVAAICTSTAGLATYNDTFDNADENPVVGWTTLKGRSAIKSVSGKALSSTDLEAGALYTSGTLTADQYSSITVGTFATYLGVGVRFSSSANTGYLAQATAATRIRLYRNVAGVQTDLSGAGYTTATIVSGDVIRVEATGTNPVHLVVKLNGTTIGTVDDSTDPIATGSPLIYIKGLTGSIDSWSGGDL